MVVMQQLSCATKPDGGVQGIGWVTFQTIGGEDYSKQFMKEAEEACAQYQGRLRVRGAYLTVQHRIGMPNRASWCT